MTPKNPRWVRREKGVYDYVFTAKGDERVMATVDGEGEHWGWQLNWGTEFLSARAGETSTLLAAQITVESAFNNSLAAHTR